jgi:prepilin-type N-terminal cleavage/methylation domain-containing protein
MRGKHGEPAYTLVELLVCIAIVSVLIGLLLPAIQKARAAVQRTTCVNNLRQIGTALHGYHDSHQAFPSGVQGPLSLPYPFMSWNAAILPHLDQDNLWNSIREAYLQDPLYILSGHRRNGLPAHGWRAFPRFHYPDGRRRRWDQQHSTRRRAPPECR